MKQRKLDEDCTKLLEDKLQTSEGKLPDPKTLIAWTHNFFKIPEFTFRDLYHSLVGKEDYSPENLGSFESLLGFRLFRNGHVVDLRYFRGRETAFAFGESGLCHKSLMALFLVLHQILECKSLFLKRNLLPGIAPSETLIKTTKAFQLKEETTWFYQILGQMAIIGIHHTNLLTYTNKGILIVPVKFNEQFCLQMLDKLHCFFVKFMVP